MDTRETPRTRPMTIIGQDPGVRDGHGEIVLDQVDVPAEPRRPGPMGCRVHVIDYDTSTQTLYKARQETSAGDPYEKYLGGRNTHRLLRDPQFHQQNVYAIVMETLGRFEFALGRRTAWAFERGGHHIKVVPHAFADANAFYSRREEALLFGYFRDAKANNIFSCLSRDVVVHEATHALLDGLRRRFLFPSSADQAAFHEGFADVVALLSVFRLKAVLDVALDAKLFGTDPRISADALTVKRLKDSLFVLAREMGKALSAARGKALRHSLDLKPPIDLESPEFREPHRRGEVLVACMLNTFLDVWVIRLKGLARDRGGWLDRNRVIEEGADVSERLLNAAIRAIDYCPPVDLLFGDYLSALLTADLAISPNDSKYGLRQKIRENFARFGIEPASQGHALEPGMWEPSRRGLSYTGIHFDSMRRDSDEMFRLVWENRRTLGLHEDAYTFVESVRPSSRVDLDGFVLRETVAEYVQILHLRGRELRRIGLRKPADMGQDQLVAVYGGGTLIFDEFGQLQFHIHNRVKSKHQPKRLKYLWQHGALDDSGRESFEQFHRARAIQIQDYPREEW